MSVTGRYVRGQAAFDWIDALSWYFYDSDANVTGESEGRQALVERLPGLLEEQDREASLPGNSTPSDLPVDSTDRHQGVNSMVATTW